MSNEFPVKCFNCGELIGAYYDEYIEKLSTAHTDRTPEEVRMTLFQKEDRIFIGNILDSMQLTNDCCRTIFITYATPDDIKNLLLR